MARRIRRLRAGGARVAFDGVSICERSVLEPDSLVAHDVSIVDSNLGRFSGVGRYSKLNAADVGPFCSIAWDVTVGAIAHPTDWPSTHAFAYDPGEGGFVAERHFASPRTALGHDVWIGANSVILPGVEIGGGAIVGAGSVVTADVAPYMVVAGNPARELRPRFDAELAARLDDSRWWEWPDSLLAERIELFGRPLDRESAEALAAASRSHPLSGS